MNSVISKALIKETNEGIPDLIIALYDHDLAQQMVVTHVDWSSISSSWLDSLGNSARIYPQD